MGLGTKQVCDDHQDEDWEQSLLESGILEPRSESLTCPRCSSTNTKFCYFNNYNKSQPRHLCKSCKRHWTKGGTLRNIPVGGGRKHKRPKISNTSTTTTTTTTTSPVQTCGKFSSVANINDHKITYNSLYHSLIPPSSPLSYNSTNGISKELLVGRDETDNTTGLNVPEPQNLNTDFTFNTFEMNSSSIMNPTSYQSLNSYDQYYPSSFVSMEESTITTVNIPSTSSIPWPGPDTTTTGIEDFPNYWNCIWKNEIELSTTSDINIAWDNNEIEIKP
ncbi:uncharacterized protein [Primulina eburnea]|uniref:uncharacterized protein n=1 Tax=Primulina eburnea TaxID=1245227 RepID=UPI003C6C96BE